MENESNRKQTEFTEEELKVFAQQQDQLTQQKLHYMQVAQDASRAEQASKNQEISLLKKQNEILVDSLWIIKELLKNHQYCE